MFCVGNKQFVQNKSVEEQRSVLWPSCSPDCHETRSHWWSRYWHLISAPCDQPAPAQLITTLSSVSLSILLHNSLTFSSRVIWTVLWPPPHHVVLNVILWKNILKENAFLCWTIICEEVSLSVFCLHCCTENTCLERVDLTAWEVKQGDWLKYKHSFLGTKRSEVSWTLLIFKHLC